MADAAKPRPLGVDFPFRVSIVHTATGMRDMFRLSEAFDFSELRGSSGSGRSDLFVDVVEVKPRAMTILVTPTRLMTYDEIAHEMERMLASVSERFKVSLTVDGISWIVEHTGVASDLRGRLHAVR
jgi:hypothetical protein